LIIIIVKNNNNGILSLPMGNHIGTSWFVIQCTSHKPGELLNSNGGLTFIPVLGGFIVIKTALYIGLSTMTAIYGYDMVKTFITLMNNINSINFFIDTVNSVVMAHSDFSSISIADLAVLYDNLVEFIDQLNLFMAEFAEIIENIENPMLKRIFKDVSVNTFIRLEGLKEDLLINLKELAGILGRSFDESLHIGYL
jgi:hypothetical protein